MLQALLLKRTRSEAEAGRDADAVARRMRHLSTGDAHASVGDLEEPEREGAAASDDEDTSDVGAGSADAPEDLEVCLVARGVACQRPAAC